jgi:hypothetical protein
MAAKPLPKFYLISPFNVKKPVADLPSFADRGPAVRKPQKEGLLLAVSFKIFMCNRRWIFCFHFPTTTFKRKQARKTIYLEVGFVFHLDRKGHCDTWGQEAF